ncbi:PREDICTED: uncharacterized protein LOC104609259 [Nelumbo nucifera]|uniref:Uncharacterized protein LOC104609259 n=2 Tax=Nelumbo nucifera TaxID=4432 RepID=A0A1U8AZK3_NELNU|nr:PREDICTED: uncharacterized protein LOC104609259 [Nelumbo nucifera]DAD49191.1 TPA_asm: hypothetical protein HUJ06_019128 [Nelumbo nucifera]
MATGCCCCSSSPHMMFQSGLIKKPVTRIFMLRDRQIQLPSAKKSPAGFQIRSSMENKVFEDQSRGIVCYRDGNGEIICEGLDEGPRFQPAEAPKPAPSLSAFRQIEIINLLQRNGFQIIEADGQKAVTAQEEVDWNGSNRFC